MDLRVKTLGLKTDVENNIYKSKIGSGFGELGGTPPPRIPRNTPPGYVKSDSPLTYSKITFFLYVVDAYILFSYEVYTKSSGTFRNYDGDANGNA